MHSIFASRIQTAGCSSVRLECWSGGPKVAGSSPVIPTKEVIRNGNLFFHIRLRPRTGCQEPAVPNDAAPSPTSSQRHFTVHQFSTHNPSLFQKNTPGRLDFGFAARYICTATQPETTTEHPTEYACPDPKRVRHRRHPSPPDTPLMNRPAADAPAGNRPANPSPRNRLLRPPT